MLIMQFYIIWAGYACYTILVPSCIDAHSQSIYAFVNQPVVA